MISELAQVAQGSHHDAKSTEHTRQPSYVEQKAYFVLIPTPPRILRAAIARNRELCFTFEMHSTPSSTNKKGCIRCAGQKGEPTPGYIAKLGFSL
jgi:hypothetical protein